MLMAKVEGPRRLSLGGRAWKVNHIDWSRRRCYVEPTDHHARSLWTGSTLPHSYELSQAQRDVLLGTDPDVELSKRASAALAEARDLTGHRATAGGSVVEDDGETRWWTWAGAHGNATIAAALPAIVDTDRRIDDHCLRLRSDVTPDHLRAAIDTVDLDALPPPEITEEAVRELKFGEILPPTLALATLADRLADRRAAQAVLTQPRRWIRSI
jgi:ATP-dependent Lhr-like helicase